MERSGSFTIVFKNPATYSFPEPEELSLCLPILCID